MSKNYELNIENRARWYECYVSINEVVHRIYYKTTLDGMFHLYVDDKCVMSKKNWIVKLKGLDYAVEIDGETLHCVFSEKKLDVAMYGKYIKSQNTYIPKKKLHRAIIVIVIIELAMGALIFIDGEKVIKLTQKEAVGSMVFLLMLLLGALKYYDNLYKKAEMKQKLKIDTDYENPKV